MLYEGSGLALDAKSLRRDLKALVSRKSDRNELRSEALALVKNDRERSFLLRRLAEVRASPLP